jgi:ATP-binding cassette subfamily B protein
MSIDDEVLWPVERAGDALEAVARAAGLAPRSADRADAPAGLAGDPDHELLEAWLDDSAARFGLEVDWLPVTYGGADALLCDNGPLLLACVDRDRGTRLLAVIGGGRRRLHVVTPHGDRRWLASEVVSDAIRRPAEAPFADEIARLFAATGMAPDRRTERHLLHARLHNRNVAQAWSVELAPGADPIAQARRAGLGRTLGALIGVRIAEYAMLLLAWWLVGRGALAGGFERGWLGGWILALACSVLFRLIGLWAEDELALRGGILLRRRLLAGALRLDPETTRTQGAGQLLGRVIESETLEALSFGGTFMVVVAAVELVAAAIVLGLGAGGTLQAVALVAWVAVALLMGRSYVARLRAWTTARLDMTHSLIERMAGHATVLAQQRPDKLHEGVDPQLERYVDVSSALDRGTSHLHALLARGWIVVGVGALVPAFVAEQPSQAALAISFGGVLLAFGAFQRFAVALPQLGGAWVAWQQVRDVFAAARAEPPSADTTALAVVPRFTATPPDPSANGEGAGVVLDARDVVFRYHAAGRPVLRGCDVQIRAGDRLLLEGPSGGGKSTLAAVLAGLREPESGLLLLGGLDRKSIGAERWRRRVAAAPQFHENHVLSGTLLFNLLMGRRWPARRADRLEAQSVCEELGLERLIAAMPSGLNQVVGETGWQLSHGERSRVYLARALLQGADVIVLDESFAALDPHTLERAWSCAHARARTLLVIAHP